MERFGATPGLCTRRARLLLVSGRLEEAHELLTHALDRVQTADERAQVCHDLGAVGLEMGDRTLAVNAFVAAIHLWGEADQPMRAAVANGELAMVHMHFGELQACEDALEESIAVLETGPDPYLHAHMLTSRAVLWLGRGRAGEARLDVQASLDLLVDGHRYGKTYAHGVMGLIELTQDRPQAALVALDAALEQADGCGFGLLEARARCRRAAALALLDRPREHRDALRAARRLLELADHTTQGVFDIVRALGELRDGQVEAGLERLRGTRGPLLARDEEARMLRELAQRNLPAGLKVLRLDNGRLVLPDGQTVPLHRHAAALRLFTALADAWPQAVPKHDLFQAGWPGQRIQEASANTRLRQELSRLRKLGVGQDLQAHDGGYRLNPEVWVTT